MKQKLRLLAVNFCVGVVIGTILSIIFSYVFGQGEYHPVSPVSTMGQYYETHFNEPTTMLIAACIWGLIGVLFSIAAMIYDASDWSLLRITLLHLIICYVGFLPLAMLAGWFPFTVLDFALFTGIFLFIYGIIWVVNYFKNKALVDMINKRLDP